MKLFVSKKRQRGFSLIELIIAIAIIVILTGLLAPQLMRYIERTRQNVCIADMDTLIQEYQMAELDKTPKDINEAQKLLASIVTAHGGKEAENEAGINTGGFFTGFCKSGGRYNCSFSSDLVYLSIDCSKHGGNVIDIETLKKRLENIDFSDLKIPYANLEEYFKGNHTSLDSEAINTDSNSGAYGKYGSLAQAVSAKLTQQGINTTNKSWRMYKKGNTYNLFLTDRKITEEDIKSGVTIKCTKYDIANGKIIHGEAKVTYGSTGKYPIISGESFKESK